MQRNNKTDFFDRIEILPNGCHQFQSWQDRDGYRQFRYQGKDWKAHRLAVVFDGRDPTGKLVCHSCDNVWCVNPQHLWIGTNYENRLDSVKKGRARGRRSHPSLIRGQFKR